MAQHCEICVAPDRAELERRALSEPYAEIARAFDVSVWGLGRHFRHHVPKALARSVELREMASGDWMAGQLLDTLARVDRVAMDARSDGQRSIELAALKERREVLALVAKVLALLPGDVTVTVNTLQVQAAHNIATVILPILDAYPELRYKIAAALAAVDHETAA
jgi:hypothetical protein